jgi:hypothetical protein
MGAADSRHDGLEKLVDHHIVLCERLGGMRAKGQRKPPMLFTSSEGKALADCYADLVDRALVTYAASGVGEDLAIFSLKAALLQAIAGELKGLIAREAGP